jgi:hypothetical protein
MSVIMTMRVSGDPARFEQTVAAEAEAIGRIMDVAKRNGLIAHRWYGSDGEFMAVDECPDQQSFQAFMEQAQPDIRPVMEAAGVTSQPNVTFWRTLDTGDAVGWGAGARGSPTKRRDDVSAVGETSDPRLAPGAITWFPPPTASQARDQDRERGGPLPPAAGLGSGTPERSLALPPACGSLRPRAGTLASASKRHSWRTPSEACHPAVDSEIMRRASLRRTRSSADRSFSAATERARRL